MFADNLAPALAKSQYDKAYRLMRKARKRELIEMHHEVLNPKSAQHEVELDCLALFVAPPLLPVEKDVSSGRLWALDEAICSAPALDHAGELSELATRFVNFESFLCAAATFAAGAAAASVVIDPVALAQR